MFNYRAVYAVALLLIMLTAWGQTGCQAPQQPPRSASSPSLPAPAVSTQPADQPAVTDNVTWAADGVITPGEYRSNKSFDGYELWWTADDTYIYVGMKAKTQGWVAVGFDPELMMQGADIVIGSVKDGKLSIADQYSTGQFGPHPADTQQGGTDDILASGGKSDGVFTTIEFKRKLDTGDKFDKALHKGTNKILWAYGSDPQFTIKHTARGPAEIDL